MRKSKFLSILLALCLTLSLLPVSALADGGTNYVKVGGIKGFESREFESFADAYTAIKPKLEALCEKDALGQGVATAEAFDALFTDRDANGNATLTYTIVGNVTYDETGYANLLTMGRRASHYGNGRHLINFKFVGDSGNRADTLTVNSDITLPYEWWGEKMTTSISFENLTITGSAGSGLYPTQSFFEGINFSVNNCTLRGIKIYNCSNVGGSYTITNSTLDGIGAAKDAYAIHLQGNETAPLTINISGNQISGYDRGINVDQKTANATISSNTISIKDIGRSCIQLSRLATTTISGNTLNLTGGNAITLHDLLRTDCSKPTVSITGNTITGNGYLIYDDAAANGNAFTADTLTLNYGTNTVDSAIDTTQGVKGLTVTPNGSTVSGAVHPAASINGVTYPTLTAAIAAVKDGETITILAAGEYTLNGSLAYTGKAFTIEAAEGVDVAFDMSAAVALHGAKITFKGVTFNYKTNGNYIGIQHADTLVYNNCIINGQVFLYAASETFNGCTFNQNSANAYNVWTYGAQKVEFNHCTFNCAGKSVLLYNEGTNVGTNLTVSNTTFNASASVEGKAAIEIDTSLMEGDSAVTVDNATKATGFAEGSKSGSTLWNDKKQTADTNKNTTVIVAGETVFAPRVATVGGVTYSSLEAAFAALTATNHTLTLTSVGEAKWPAATPVYWKAGTQSGYAATLTAALTEAYKANAGDITIVCRPGADVGTMTHGHVADNLIIFGNNAYISDGECDLEVDTYKYSRATGAQAADGAYLDKDITITGYELDNLGVWGQRHTNHTVTVSLTDCDGKAIEGKDNVQRVYISGETGVNNITLKDCDFITNNTSVYSNADGVVMIDSCSFTGSKVPVNFNHKANGTQTVTVKNSSFTGCGDNDKWKQFAAPVRFVNSGTGTMSANVSDCTITYTKGANGDILIGDGRKGESSNDVTLTVSGTNGTVVAQRPGYYNGDATASGKRADAAVKSGDSPLVTTLNKMLPVKNEIDLDEFLAMVKSAGYNFDGAAVTGDGSKLVVKWSPVSGCYDTRAGHACKVNNVKATGNTPTYINSKLAQYFEFHGQENVTIKNVNFVYVADNFTICANNNGISNYWTKDEIKTAQLYLRNSGNTTIEGCSFDNVAFTSFDNTGTTVIKNSAFKNTYGTYAIKDLGGSGVEVSNCTFENCGGGIMLDSNRGRTVTPATVEISGNTFTNVDVAGTAPESKVGTRALIQFPSKGNYTDAELILDGNTASNCGPILRQLNENGAVGMIERLTGDLTGLGGKLTYTSDSKSQTSQPTTYTVTFSGSNVAPVVAAAGTAIILPNADRVGFTLSYWKDWTNGAAYRAGESFTVNANVTLYAEWVENSSPVTPGRSSVSVVRPDNGKVTVNPSAAKEGETVTITVTPDAGYELGSLTVSDSRGNQLPLSGSGSSFTFVMPAGGAVVKAEFVKRSVSFGDVSANDYFASAVAWAVEKGITDGVGGGMFGPYQPCTRGQIVTFLWRAAGSPEPKAMSSFADVSANEYYAKAVAWAVENGITTGTTATTFGPNDTCTRAQAVTFLCRAVGTQGAYSGAFSDVASDMYCAGSVAWAVEKGVTDGVGGGKFAPDNFCTRGQIVTFLYRAYQGK